MNKTSKMKKLATILTILIGLLGVSGQTTSNPQPSAILQKVANANGFQKWDEVTEIKFTFNVDRDTTHFERKWVWKPKTNDITAITEESKLEYNWSDMDSTAYKTNAGFINDKYWLLAPFQLVWDAPNITHEHQTAVEAPISRKPMQKLTIFYGNEGGYTPGDAYDFYFEDDLIIREWVFRKGNQPAPSMITTWEDYKETNGLTIATMHRMPESDFKLYFTGIEVKTD